MLIPTISCIHYTQQKKRQREAGAYTLQQMLPASLSGTTTAEMPVSVTGLLIWHSCWFPLLPVSVVLMHREREGWRSYSPSNAALLSPRPNHLGNACVPHWAASLTFVWIPFVVSICFHYIEKEASQTFLLSPPQDTTELPVSVTGLLLWRPFWFLLLAVFIITVIIRGGGKRDAYALNSKGYTREYCSL